MQCYVFLYYNNYYYYITRLFFMYTCPLGFYNDTELNWIEILNSIIIIIHDYSVTAQINLAIYYTYLYLFCLVLVEVLDCSLAFPLSIASCLCCKSIMKTWDVFIKSHNVTQIKSTVHHCCNVLYIHLWNSCMTNFSVERFCSNNPVPH